MAAISQFAKICMLKQLNSREQICGIMQISLTSVKWFLRYHDFSIFKMAAVCHLGFSNFWLLIGLGWLHHTNFY